MADESTRIRRLGEPQFVSPLLGDAVDDLPDGAFISDDDFIRIDDLLNPSVANDSGTPPALELAGPRRSLFFNPHETSIGIVTCGGLCPGLNDVIRGLVMESWYRYGVRTIYGFRYGFRGCLARTDEDVLRLTPDIVSDIHEQGGTLLGSSRGPQNVGEIVDAMSRLGIGILYVVGGDGTIRGAMAIGHEARRRNVPLSVVGIPKTIDNDIQIIDRSFGFETAYTAAVESVYGAHTEARCAPRGVGLVKLMGRHSGFIACHAALASSHVNFVLIPEVEVELDGDGGFLAALHQRLNQRGHAVVVVAEGAGQNLLAASQTATDASGNKKLGDIGTFLCDRIRDYFNERNEDCSLKYIDPSYLIRSIPASPPDSVYCWYLAQSAVHAGMTGRTELIIGEWHGRLVHVPMERAAAGRKQVDPHGELWSSVLESTGQPRLWNSLGH